MSSLPIILYIGSSSCPACVRFENEQYTKLQEEAAGKYQIIQFKKMKPDEDFDYCLKDKIAWFPTFMFVSPQEYAKFYDKTGNYTSSTNDKLMKCEVYNMVNIDGKVSHMGKPSTADAILQWASVMAANMKI